MREVLFKAKGKNGEGWQEGYYLKTNETSYCVQSDYDNHPDNTKHYLLYVQMSDWGLPNRKLSLGINPKTICQYTGLKDKNGKKIFENDIVRCDKRGAAFYRGCVSWNDINARYDVIAMNCPFPITLDEGNDSISIRGEDYEVIGNTYDRAELKFNGGGKNDKTGSN